MIVFVFIGEQVYFSISEWQGMSASHKAFHQRPYFMVVFGNETSAIDKDKFRIVFLKKFNEFSKKFLFKLMM